MLGVLGVPKSFLTILLAPLVSASLAESRFVSSLFEIGGPLRVERLGVALDFDVPNDRGLRGSDESRTLAVRGSEGPLA